MELKDILLLIGGAFIGLVINYITQFTSTPLANKFNEWRNEQAQKRASRSVKKAKKRLEEIEAEIIVVTWYVNNPISFSAFAFGSVQRMIFRLSFLLFVGIIILISNDQGVSSIWSAIFSIAFFIILEPEDKDLKVKYLFRKINRYPVYLEDMNKQIVELQKVVNGE